MRYLIWLLALTTLVAAQRVNINRPIEYASLSSHLQGLIDDAEKVAEDTAHVAASTSRQADKTRSSFTLDGTDDDVQIKTIIDTSPDTLRLTFASGLYSLDDVDGDGYSMYFKNKKFLFIDMRNARFELEASTDSWMMFIDSCETVYLYGGSFFGNGDNQSAGGGITIQNSSNVYVLGLVADSTYTHALALYSLDRAFVDWYSSLYSVAGRGLDGDWDVNGDTEGGYYHASNFHVENHALAAIKMENMHSFILSDYTSIERFPKSGSTAALTVGHNDMASDSTLWGKFINGHHVGKVIVNKVSGPIEFIGCTIDSGFYQLENSNPATSIIGGYVRTQPTVDNRIIDAASTVTGFITVRGMRGEGTGAVNTAFEFEGDARYVAENNILTGFGGRAVYLYANADTSEIRNNTFISAGSDGGTEIGVYALSGWNDISGNTFENFRVGIHVSASSDSNTINWNKFYGDAFATDSAITVLGDGSYLIHNWFDRYTFRITDTGTGNTIVGRDWKTDDYFSIRTPGRFEIYPNGEKDDWVEIYSDGSNLFINVQGANNFFVGDNLAPSSDNSKWLGNVTYQWIGVDFHKHSIDPGDSGSGGAMRVQGGQPADPDTIHVGSKFWISD